MTQSQNTRILNYLKSGRSLTPLEALKKFDCWALSSRVAEINRPSRIVKMELVKVGKKTVAKYSMA